MPLEGYNVIITLADGSELLGYWMDGSWWTGVENDPNDIKVEGVVSWREVT